MIVNYHVEENAKPSTPVVNAGYPAKIRKSSLSLTIDSLSNFYDDLHLLRRVRRSDFREESHSHRHYKEFEDEDEFDSSEDDRHDEAIREFKDVLTNKEEHLKHFQQDGYEALLESCRMFAQRSYLERRSIGLGQWLDVFTGVLTKKESPELQKILGAFHQNYRGFLLSRYFSVALPGTPTSSGGNDAFKKQTEIAFRNYYENNVILNPLSHPIKVTIFLIPPENGGKDLDNLALKVVPVIHDVLKPPTFEKLSKRDLNRGPKPATAAGNITGVHQEMVTSYQIVEIPRNASDPPGGSVQVLFGDGYEVCEDVWRQVTRVIDKWEDSIKNY